MEQETGHDDREPVPLPPDRAYDAWKHYSTVGGADKNTMVTVTSWLLGFSAAIIGYMVTTDLENRTTFVLSGIGVAVSTAAGFVALVYAGYANWNWARANDIAHNRGWYELLPDELTTRHRPHQPQGLAVRSARLSKPNCAPDRIAPIFQIYFALAALTGIAHIVIGVTPVVILVWTLIDA